MRDILYGYVNKIIANNAESRSAHACTDQESTRKSTSYTNDVIDLSVLNY